MQARSRMLNTVKRDFPDRPMVGVGAVIIDRDRVVLVRRAREPLFGEWSVPGGMLELGETLRQGTEREALEETGLRVKAGEVIDVFDSIWGGEAGRPQYHYVLIDFLCTVVSGELCAGSDAGEARWFREEELGRLGLRASVTDVVTKAFHVARS
jgi:ADP-ribose pyrophosphatase YjhB (NUDIX family)